MVKYLILAILYTISRVIGNDTLIDYFESKLNDIEYIMNQKAIRRRSIVKST